MSIDKTICAAPVFSLDGAWLYFQSNAWGAYHLYRCRPDGSAREQLTSGERPGSPWNTVFGLPMTATGQLLCTAYDGKTGCTAVLSSDGSRMRLVASYLGYLYMSAISPQGEAVIVSGSANGYRLWLLNLPEAFRRGADRLTGPSADLARQHPQSFAPQFTPDGCTIIYFRRDGDVYRVSRDETEHRRLTKGNHYVEFRLSAQDRHGSTDGPHLSPDGKRIAFIALRDAVPQVCVIDVDGSNLRQLTRRATPCGRVRWSPDGQKIAFVSFVGKPPQLYVINAEGSPPEATHLPGRRCVRAQLEAPGRQVKPLSRGDTLRFPWSASHRLTRDTRHESTHFAAPANCRERIRGQICSPSVRSGCMSNPNWAGDLPTHGLFRPVLWSLPVWEIECQFGEQGVSVGAFRIEYQLEKRAGQLSL